MHFGTHTLGKDHCCFPGSRAGGAHAMSPIISPMSPRISLFFHHRRIGQEEDEEEAQKTHTHLEKNMDE